MPPSRQILATPLIQNNNIPADNVIVLISLPNVGPQGTRMALMVAQHKEHTR